MSKRKQDNSEDKGVKKSELKHEDKSEDEDELEYEDNFEDEYEEEEIIENSDDDDEDDDDGNVDRKFEKEMDKLNKKMDKMQIWDPKSDPLKDGEVLDFDETAYKMYYTYETEWPCLSFDVVLDNLGYNRTKFPKSAIIVGGSQSGNKKEDRIYVVKMTQLHEITSDSEELEDEDNEDDDEESNFYVHQILHPGCVNRIRSLSSCPQLISTFCDNSKLYIWDISNVLNNVDKISHELINMNPIYTFEGHSTEGYAIDWNPSNNYLLSGDCNGNIYLHSPNESNYSVNGSSFVGHKKSVEDLHWSPSEDQVFASCSVDKHIRIWDCRNHKTSMIDCLAHESDINVISWNKLNSSLFLTGCDDGSFKVWDVRKLQHNKQLAHYKWYSDPITSIQWSYAESSVLAVSADDGQATLWDLSLEKDDTDKNDDLDNIPPQLIFIHRGQTLTKELRFHPQLPGVIFTTAQDGFNIFQPDVEVLPEGELEEEIKDTFIS